MWPSHRGRPRAKVNLKWLEAVNRYGVRPHELFRAIYTISLKEINKIPGTDFGFKENLNSLTIVEVTLDRITPRGEGVSQKAAGKRARAVILDSQFTGSPIQDTGSNLENRLDIW